MQTTLSPNRLVEILRRERQESIGRPILAYWNVVLSDRQRYSEDLRSIAAEIPVVALVLRSGFENENSVMTDLRRLIEDNRQLFEAPAFPAAPVDLPLTLVLLSRTPLSFPQCTSPTVLPGWFPVQGGELIHIKIENLIWKAQGGLDVAEAETEELCEKLCRLDRVAVARWKRCRARTPSRGDEFFALLVRDPRAVTADDFLKSVEEYHRLEICNPAGFRPSAKPDTPSLVGRLFSLAARISRDGLLEPARKLAAALDLPADRTPPDDSLVTVLGRSTNSVPHLPTRLTRNLILTSFAASQFVNTKSHADKSPEYPIVLLQSFSYDLRATLEELIRCLEEWPEASAP